MQEYYCTCAERTQNRRIIHHAEGSELCSSPRVSGCCPVKNDSTPDMKIATTIIVCASAIIPLERYQPRAHRAIPIVLSAAGVGNTRGNRLLSQNRIQ